MKIRTKYPFKIINDVDPNDSDDKGEFLYLSDDRGKELLSVIFDASGGITRITVYNEIDEKRSTWFTVNARTQQVDHRFERITHDPKEKAFEVDKHGRSKSDEIIELDAAGKVIRREFI